MLHPASENPHCSPSDLVRARLKSFCQGLIKSLWLSAQTKRTPTKVQSDEDLAHQAQVAADEDNCHAAHAGTIKALPLAEMNQHNQDICSKLCPNPTGYSIISNRPLCSGPRHPASDDETNPKRHRSRPQWQLPRAPQGLGLLATQRSRPRPLPNFQSFSNTAQSVINSEVPTALHTTTSSN